MNLTGEIRIGRLCFAYLCTRHSFWPWRRRWHVMLSHSPWDFDLDWQRDNMAAWGIDGLRAELEIVAAIMVQDALIEARR